MHLTSLNSAVCEGLFKMFQAQSSVPGVGDPVWRSRRDSNVQGRPSGVKLTNQAFQSQYLAFHNWTQLSDNLEQKGSS